MRKIKYVGLILGFIALVSLNAHARDLSADVKAKMGQLTWIEGTWTGETMMSRTGKKLPETITLTETAHFEMDGMILILEGVGMKGGEEVSHSYTYITYNAKRQRYFMYALTDDGNILNPTFNANDQGMQWKMNVRNGQGKYTIEDDAGSRTETSWHSTDGGETWEAVFSVTLEKQ